MSHAGSYGILQDAYGIYERGCCEFAAVGYGYQMGLQNHSMTNMQPIQGPEPADYRAALMHGTSPEGNKEETNSVGTVISPPVVRSILKRPTQLDIPGQHQQQLPFYNNVNQNQSVISGCFYAEVTSPMAGSNNGFYSAVSPPYELFGGNRFGQMAGASSLESPQLYRCESPTISAFTDGPSNYDNYEMTQLCSFLKAL